MEKDFSVCCLYRFVPPFWAPLLNQNCLNHFHLKSKIRGNSDYSNCSKVFTLFVVSFKGALQLHATFPSLMGLPVSSLEEKCHQKKVIYLHEDNHLCTVKGEEFIHVPHCRHLPSLLAYHSGSSIISGCDDRDQHFLGSKKPALPEQQCCIIWATSWGIFWLNR